MVVQHCHLAVKHMHNNDISVNLFWTLRCKAMKYSLLAAIITTLLQSYLASMFGDGKRSEFCSYSCISCHCQRRFLWFHMQLRFWDNLSWRCAGCGGTLCRFSPSVLGRCRAPVASDSFGCSLPALKCKSLTIHVIWEKWLGYISMFFDTRSATPGCTTLEPVLGSL